MPAFGFSVGDVIATAEFLRKALGGLKATTGAAAQYQRTIIELESLERVLRVVQRLVSESSGDDIARVDSLRAAAFATSLTLRDFLQKLQKYDADLGSASRNPRVQRAARAVQYTLLMDEDVNKLQLYLSGQMLSINTLLQLVDRDIATRRDDRNHAQLSEIMQSGQRQAVVVEGLSRALGSIATTTTGGYEVTQSVFKATMKNTMILQDLSRRIPAAPSFAGENAIRFIDALGREYTLPFAYFHQWEVFESFVKQAFAGPHIAGYRQVSDGSFFISESRASRRALSKANWLSAVYPGVKLSMTVIMTMLKLQLETCPRPSCGSVATTTLNSNHFSTCPECGLVFRHHPDVQLLGLKPEYEKLREIQEFEDLTNYGRRLTPLDTAEAHEDFETDRSPGPLRQPDPAQTTGNLSTDNLDKHRELASLSAINPISSDQPEQPAATLSSIDWNSGNSGMSAWLNSSALPSAHTHPDNSAQDSFKLEVEQLAQECNDIEAIKRVVFTSVEPQTRPLQNTAKDYQKMPLNEQVYFRKIVDRYPQVPAFLTKRFAKSNVARTVRLRNIADGDQHSPRVPELFTDLAAETGLDT